MNNDTSAPSPFGTCEKCGGGLFYGVVHFCPTAPKPEALKVNVSEGTIINDKLA